MAVTLATGYVQLVPSARGFQAAAERELKPQMGRAGETAGAEASTRFGSKFSGGMGRIGKAAAVGLAGAKAVAAILGKQAVDAASNLEETQNKVNAVFGEGADEVNAWAKTASTAIGQSERQALDAAGSFGNLFVQLGIGADQAAGMSTEMVGLASDFASFHNADISEVLNAQQAAFRGEYDALQRFVPTINAAAVEQEAMRLGLAASTSELDAQDKALATQSLMLSGAGDAAGDFARTSDGLANQQRIASARFEELSASLGQALIPIMSKVMEVAIGVADAIQRNWPAIRAAVSDVMTNIQNAWMQYGKPAFDAIVGAAQFVVAIIRDNWPEISARVAGVWQQVQEIIRAAATIITGIITAVVTTVSFIWRNFGNEIVSAIRSAWNFIVAIVRAAIDVVHGIIKVVTSLIRGDWGKAWEGIKQVFSGVWDGIKAVLKLGTENLKTVLSAAVSALKILWSPIEGIWTFIRDRVINPVVNGVTGLKDSVVNLVGQAVDGALSAWGRIVEIYNFFNDRVIRPIKSAVSNIRDTLVDWFGRAVDGVQTAWNRLKDIVKAPINVVIGFYNNGIRRIWNNTIGKVGLPELGPIATLATGGRVPGGRTHRDTVPAMLTPGEFVVPERAADAWGPGILELIRRGPRGQTVDPGILGYAAGGFVHSAEEVLAWARQQAGKRYRFPLVGPDAYDCSGFSSAMVNFALGRFPYTRRHSSGSVGSDPALTRGAGDPLGLMIGARPPYMTNAQGARVGHVTTTIAGVNAEATPPAVRVGGNARGASALPNIYHLAGFGGLSDSDKLAAGYVAQLPKMAASGGGGGWFGDIVRQMINRIPGMLYDFFLKRLPAMIVDAVKDAVRGVTGAIRGVFVQDVTGSVGANLANRLPGAYQGGRVVRDGLVRVGEQGEEILELNRGDRVHPNGAELGARFSFTVEGNVYGVDDLERHFRRFHREIVQAPALAGVRH